MWRTLKRAAPAFVPAWGEPAARMPLLHERRPGVSDLLDPARSAIARALELGATGAECTVSEGEEFSVNVRMREVENLKQAGSRGMGIRVLVGQRPGSSYTSDLAHHGSETMERAALAMAQPPPDDPHAALTDAADFGEPPSD